MKNKNDKIIIIRPIIKYNDVLLKYSFDVIGIFDYVEAWVYKAQQIIEKYLKENNLEGYESNYGASYSDNKSNIDEDVLFYRHDEDNEIRFHIIRIPENESYISKNKYYFKVDNR